MARLRCVLLFVHNYVVCTACDHSSFYFFFEARRPSTTAPSHGSLLTALEITTFSSVLALLCSCSFSSLVTLPAFRPPSRFTFRLPPPNAWLCAGPYLDFASASWLLVMLSSLAPLSFCSLTSGSVVAFSCLASSLSDFRQDIFTFVRIMIPSCNSPKN